MNCPEHDRELIEFVVAYERVNDGRSPDTRLVYQSVYGSTRSDLLRLARLRWITLKDRRVFSTHQSRSRLEREEWKPIKREPPVVKPLKSFEDVQCSDCGIELYHNTYGGRIKDEYLCWFCIRPRHIPAGRGTPDEESPWGENAVRALEDQQPIDVALKEWPGG